jgi:hypothetical protein
MYGKTAMNGVTTGIGSQSSAPDYLVGLWENGLDFAGRSKG